jgi:tetratricopeptide (TPR) repeat protein
MPTKSVKRNSSGASRAAAKSSRLSGGAAKARSNHHSRVKVKALASNKLKPSAKQSKVQTSAARAAVRAPVVDERHAAAVRSFETGLHLEQRQNFKKAREIFEKLVATAPADIADRARVHVRACVERGGQVAKPPKTAGEYHVLGVAELNLRDLDSAVEHLSKALKLEPQREEIRYALAAAYSLQGNAEAALEQLKAAIALRPQNRFQARHDADFQPLAGDPRFLSLVSQDGSWAGVGPVTA